MQDAFASQPGNAAPTRLRFDGPVALVGGGAASEDDVREAARRSSAVIAADGGCDLCARAGAAPLAAVIGDMDSARDLGRWRDHPGCQVIEIAEQDTTDFEKCLYTVDAPLYLGVGFFGRRLDHSLAALHVMLRRRAQKIILIGEEDVVFLAPPLWRAELAPGARVSILPLTPCRGLGSTGLRWPIGGLDFALGRRIGSSNEADAALVTTRFDRPGAALLLERRFLDAAIASLTAPEDAPEKAP